MKPFRRVVIMVLDSLGVGELPDAADFGDAGASTLAHTHAAMKGLKIPHLAEMGLLALVDSSSTTTSTRSRFMRMMEVSKGKDTTTGHWEMMGLPVTQPMTTFFQGFPADLLKEWSAQTGCNFLGNEVASGTEIIARLGEEHCRTKKPIVYTSADSVFQIAAHEEFFGLQKLYKVCEITRRLLDKSPHKVGRVIARPFLGADAKTFKRTGNRKDYSIEPHGPLVLEACAQAGVSVIGIGKIPSIYNYKGITEKITAHNDQESFEGALQALDRVKGPAVIFTNLNDLDMIYGHRRDAVGYGKQIEWIDSQMPRMLEKLGEDDLLLLTADHGNDPTFKGTDHTREYVPLLAMSPRFAKKSFADARCADRKSMSDLGQSLCENFGLPSWPMGKSFLNEICH
jgi:phosphopentomutase